MPTPRQPSHDLLRLTTRVATMYHERRIGQARIAEQLGLSQARVSRLLKQAGELGIVRTTVQVPAGVHAEVEEKIELQYGLDEALVVEMTDGAAQDDEQSSQALSATAANYLELSVPTWRHIGVSSWSATLLHAVNVMRATGPGETESVVQVMGGLGFAASQVFATRLTERLAQLAKAEAIFMLAPGVVSSLATKEVLLNDPSCVAALGHFDELSALLMGVGAIPPSRMLRESGNVFTEQDLEDLREAGAVGDVCMRFFDAEGRHLRTPFDQRVLGIDVEQIRRTRRRVAVAAGERKFEAIRAALRGGWISTLITDLGTAQRLLAAP
ncbi:sugar-binding domain-containing protein [Variovorax sp. J22G21]|uniref:sugar-binding transcriptional regulator n=1 Tax=Variovorax fucosicus TaxID=3053517 RepID=UPI002574F411|nr:MULTISPECIES: sugar-binding domain-containing protein [unclassified Variovorax]MDM0038246.1 sugar-binding domain-containing protein [Variovorax sp. J22R193]MDM0056080.1 sugar-binding domain-containing protein [Variovorax sp. J22G47]MDM0063022.1 sugar-binding domain-containing protein [Variovorax sp. J22G21]